jgi:hypothetical protein
MDTVLQILISAVDGASATLDEIGQSLSAMSEEAAATTEAASASFEEFGLQVNETTGEIENALLTQQQSFAVAADIVNSTSDEMTQVMVEEGVSAQEAAAVIAEANAEIASSSEEATTSSAGAYAGMAAIAGIAFLAIKSGIGDAIGAASNWDETSAQIIQILKDTGSAIPLSAIQAYAEQVQSTTLFTQQDVLSSAALILSHKQLQGSYQETTVMAADLATKMGTDLPNATRMLTNALTDPVAGLNQLIRQGNIDFPAATVTIIENMAKVGNTAGADQIILQTLSGSIGGLATAAANAQGGALTQMENQLTSLGIVIGNDLLPLFDALAKDLGPIIADVSAWATEHPKLTDAIVIGSAALAALLLLIGLIGVAIITVTPVIAVIGVVIGALASPIGLLAVSVVALVALIVLNWNNLKADTEAIWTDIANFFSNIWQTIISGLKTDINNVIDLINGLITAIDGLHISIPAIKIPGTSIGTPAVNIGFDIPQIPHLAQGGIVSVPTVALIGESGPEAIVPLSSSRFGGGASGSQQIVVNINGGNYLDSQGANMIAQQLAKQVLRGLKVTGYAL